MQTIDERKIIINEMIFEDEVFISKMDKLNEKGKELVDNIQLDAEKIAEQTVKLEDDEAYRYMAEHIKRAKKNIVKSYRKYHSPKTEDKISDDSDRIPDEQPSYLTDGAKDLQEKFKTKDQDAAKKKYKNNYKNYKQYKKKNRNN